MKALLWVLVIFIQIGENKGCLEEERIGLLHLKSFLKSIPYANSDHLLPSWVDDSKSTECCDWERVTCNSTTSHIIELSLENLKQDPYYREHKYKNVSFGDRWLLNVSMLEPFKELRSLDISFNAIGGWIPYEGFEKLSSLRNLEILNLGYNFFHDNGILQSLGDLTSLKTLNFTSNLLEGYFPAQGWKSLSRLENLEKIDLSHNYLNDDPLQSLVAIKSLKNLNLAWNQVTGSFLVKDWKLLSRLENLEILDLSHNCLNDNALQSLVVVKSLKNLNLAGNQLTGTFPTKDLVNCSRLEILDVSKNLFTGSISPSIGELISLKVLSVSSNELNGTLPTRELCALKKLEELDLSHNQFEGTLPLCMNNMTSLKLLDISENQLNGNVSSYVIASPKSLEYIDFSYNQFQGRFPIRLFANHSKLQVIRFINRNNKLEIETENSLGWVPLFQLKVLELSNCSLNKLSGNVPGFLLDQHELVVVDLSRNKLKGSIPNWLVENNTRLQILDLQDNSFMGHLQWKLYHHMHISWMDVSENQLSGKLQEDIGRIFPNAKYLNLSHNTFEGSLPSSINGMIYLEVLDFSFNNFSGEVPKEFVNSCTLLKIMNLGYNNLQGEIFLEQFKSPFFEFLQLKYNHFTSIVSILNASSLLYMIDISNNDISGTIPRWLGNMTYLWTLVMANNYFYDQIPCELSARSTIDFSHNLASGSLPSCLNLQGLEHLYFQGNKLTGPLPKALFNSSSLLTLDIRDNNFFGSIPDEIRELYNLKVLLLGGNHFSGIISDQLCWLRTISIIDLSKNAFSGTIPRCFSNIYFGKITTVNCSSFPRKTNLVWLGQGAYSYKRVLEKHVDYYDYKEYTDVEVKVEFVTKYRSLSYGGSVLAYMSGLDLSCNKLTGGIPRELGKISSMHAINLSYNQLTGSIPKTFSNLSLLESLDLSHNSLSGQIPSLLIGLTFLEVFNVAYNNLSGKVPDLKAQFGTFEKSSYEGNQFLCGPPLQKSCAMVDTSVPTQSSVVSGNKWYEADPVVFLTSFSVFTR
ncbi:receptor like protein 21-like [Juglans microcarpa x Juglans regia]|uniref:receptor like protein 21-like n=1 Tax=Juglans microcarpa x Juglans regia TaxID=2249226 RepID=UPI001B7F0645|nr:receptor like protein 21-like [Juglans microcarpa x Juglans regia]